MSTSREKIFYQIRYRTGDGGEIDYTILPPDDIIYPYEPRSLENVKETIEIYKRDEDNKDVPIWYTKITEEDFGRDEDNSNHYERFGGMKGC